MVVVMTISTATFCWDLQTDSAGDKMNRPDVCCTKGSGGIFCDDDKSFYVLEPLTLEVGRKLEAY